MGGKDREDEEGARDTPVQGGGDRLTTLHPKLSSSKQEPGQVLGSKACPLPSLAHCLPAPQSHVSLGVSISVLRTALKTQVTVKSTKGR